MYVIGTAGHVDHGKSTLITSLTGINPDRLKEERDRQMTIDLGFAWYTLPSGEEIGIVDVPGHRDFIDNMLAGVGGIDAVLLVIAADEGIMPQSREHLNILKLLRIEKGLIVLTKIDRVDDTEWLEMVEADIRELVAGTFLQDSSILHVSAINNIGLDELSNAIDGLLKGIIPNHGGTVPRLPIDRVFSLKGFGTVVTGTLVDGDFSVGDQVVVLPPKKQSRIRGIQNHKKKQDIAKPGNRTAINLIGLEVKDIERGDVLCLPDTITTTKILDVRIEILGENADALKHDDQVKVFLGTSQTIARVRVIGEKQITPGRAGFAQLMLVKEVVAQDGDRFILRRPSPPSTIGGGIVVNSNPGKRHKRFVDSVINRFEISASGSIEDQVLLSVADMKVITFKQLLEIQNAPAEELIPLINTLIKDGLILQIKDKNKPDEDWLLSGEYWNGIKESIFSMLEKFHQDHPLRKGVEPKVLEKIFDIDKGAARPILHAMISQNILLLDEGYVKTPAHVVQLSPEQKGLVEQLLQRFEDSENKPPSVSESIEMVGEDLYRWLLSSQDLIEISSSVVFLTRELKKIIESTKILLAKVGKVTVAEFRDEYRTTRKYAVALLECMDGQKITKREGDFRILNSG